MMWYVRKHLGYGDLKVLEIYINLSIFIIFKNGPCSINTTSDYFFYIFVTRIKNSTYLTTYNFKILNIILSINILITRKLF